MRVWVWNGEDPKVETQRRIAAICKYYGINRGDVEGYLFLDSGRDTEIKVAYQDRKGFQIAAPVVEQVLSNAQTRQANTTRPEHLKGGKSWIWALVRADPEAGQIKGGHRFLVLVGVLQKNPHARDPASNAIIFHRNDREKSLSDIDNTALTPRKAVKEVFRRKSRPPAGS